MLLELSLVAEVGGYSLVEMHRLHIAVAPLVSMGPRVQELPSLQHVGPVGIGSRAQA